MGSLQVGLRPCYDCPRPFQPHLIRINLAVGSVEILIILLDDMLKVGGRPLSVDQGNVHVFLLRDGGGEMFFIHGPASRDVPNGGPMELGPVWQSTTIRGIFDLR